MAYDERDGRRRGRGPRREPGERGPEWRGEEGFGGGWGNQVPRPHRTGDRDWTGWRDDPDHRLDQDAGSARFGRAGIGNFGYDIGTAGLPGAGAGDFAIDRHDPHYADWRDREIAALDRDYDDYRRETQTRFDREFGDWRARRSEQRAALGRVEEHMEVTGSDGGHVGTVDCTRGERIVLTRSDEAAGGVHHAIPCAWVERVDDKVVLNIDAAEARRRWQSENRSRALFEREDSGGRGPHVLNRSFAGTYPDKE